MIFSLGWVHISGSAGSKAVHCGCQVAVPKYTPIVYENIGFIILLLANTYNFKIFANLINSYTLQSLITCNNFSLYLLALCLWQNFNFLWAVLQLFDISTLGQHLFDVTEFKFLRKQFRHWSYKVNSFLSIWEQNSKSQFLQ